MPVPAGATMLTRNGRRSPNARRATSSSCIRSASRPIIGVRRRGGLPPAEQRSRGHRRGLALGIEPEHRPEPEAGGRRRASGRRPGSPRHRRACWSRAATLTGSPVIRNPGRRRHRGVRRPRRRDAEADRQAFAERRIGAHAIAQVERGAEGALGIVSVGDRQPEHGHDRITDELLDRPAVALDDLAGDRVVAAQERRMSSGSSDSPSVGRAPDIGEQDRDEASFLGHGAPSADATAQRRAGDTPPGKERRTTAGSARAPRRGHRHARPPVDRVLGHASRRSPRPAAP